MYNNTHTGYIYFPPTPQPFVLSEFDVQRIADAVVKKLEARESTEPKSWEDLFTLCANCRQPKDSPGHELGCDAGRKEYGHD